MEQFIKVNFEVRCDWEGFPPDYRVYVNDEMFAERTFKWRNDTFIKEVLQIEAVPGIYTIRVDQLSPFTGTFDISAPTVLIGNAEVLDNNRFEIYESK